MGGNKGADQMHGYRGYLRLCFRICRFSHDAPQSTVILLNKGKKDA